MIIKKYRADTVEEARQLAEAELGPEVIVLTTRRLKEKGLKGMFASEKIELTAAIEDGSSESSGEASVDTSSPSIGKESEPVAEGQLNTQLADLKRMMNTVNKTQTEEGPISRPISTVDDDEDSFTPGKSEKVVSTGTYGDPRRKGSAKPSAATTAAARSPRSAAAAILEASGVKSDEVQDNVTLSSLMQGKALGSTDTLPVPSDDLAKQQLDLLKQAVLPKAKRMIETIDEEPETATPSRRSRRARSSGGADAESIREMIREEMSRAQESSSVGSLEGNDEDIAGSVRFLLNKGVSRSLALEIEKKLGKNLGKVDLTQNSKERGQWMNALKAELSKHIRVGGPILLRRGEPTVHALVGPTGVGKTTTAAKLAVQYATELKKKVSIITFDVSKGGAFQQLKSLTEPYAIPVAQARNATELQQLVNSMSDQNLILIDTSGKNAYHWQDLDELTKTLSVIDELNVSLVLSATTKDIDVYGAIKHFDCFNYESLVFTKLDETIAHGILINVCKKTNKPISYLCSGQTMENALKVADSEDIARGLLVQHNTREFQQLRKLASS